MPYALTRSLVLTAIVHVVQMPHACCAPPRPQRAPAAASPSRVIVLENGKRNEFLLHTEVRREPLAMGGFCVVSLRDQSEWIPGQQQRTVVFDGRQYAFADARKLQIFTMAPDDYAPVLNGDCPVVLADSGERTSGQLGFGLIHNRRLYFFASAEHRRKFSDDPDRYADADLYASGACLVSQVDDKRAIQGNPQAHARAQGLRYFFASAHFRDLFLNDPGRYLGESTGAEGTSRKAAPAPALRESGSDGSDATQLAEAPTDDGPQPDKVAETPAAPLAMSGYCPVSIRDEGLWVVGRSDQLIPIDDLTFAFAGTDEKETFEADLGRYIPVLAGACAVTYVKTGKREPGSIYHAAQFPQDGLLFLFASAVEKAAFKANPERYARIDLAGDGLCPVTKRDAQRDVAGDPTICTWHAGWRYYFADAEQRQKFLDAPQLYAIDPHAPQVAQ